MNESTWHPQPGDRVLIRNAGEYGVWVDRPRYAWTETYLGMTVLDSREGRRFDDVTARVTFFVTGDPVTVLRSDLSPVEPPRLPAAMGWGPTFEPDYSPWTTDHPTFERHTDPETEEARRLTKEDYGITPFSLEAPFVEGGDELRFVAGGVEYEDIEQTRKAVLFDEMVAELIETVSAKLAESYRARTRKEKDLFSQSTDLER